MSEAETITKLQARVAELEAEVASLKTKLKSSSTLAKSGKQYSAITLRRKENRTEATNYVKTQITEWLNKVLKPEKPFEPDTLMESLMTGVVLCELALATSDKAVGPLGKIHLTAPAGSILAHDNIKSFIHAAVVLGVDPRELFDPSCLITNAMQNRNDREVVYSLLSFALVAHARYGLPAPVLSKADTATDVTLMQCLRSAMNSAASVGSNADILEAVGLGNALDSPSASGWSSPSAASSPTSASTSPSSAESKNRADDEDGEAASSAPLTEEERKKKEAEERRLKELTVKQEFFFLTALAVKMTHDLREDVCVVSSEELWQQALAQDIPFFKFNSFIENELTKAYLEAGTKTGSAASTAAASTAAFTEGKVQGGSSTETARLAKAVAMHAAADASNGANDGGTTTNLRQHRERVLAKIHARQQKASLLDDLTKPKK